MLSSRVSHLHSLLMLSKPSSSLTLIRDRQSDATCRMRHPRIHHTVMRRPLPRHVSSRRLLHHLSATPWMTVRRHSRESAMGMASLRPALNPPCRISRRLVSHPHRNNIQIYPNKPPPSCKIIISPSPIARYRHLLISHRGRQVAKDPHLTATQKLYICTNDTWHTPLIAPSFMFVECSGLVIRLLFLIFCTIVPSSPPSISIWTYLFCLALRFQTLTFIYTDILHLYSRSHVLILVHAFHSLHCP